MKLCLIAAVIAAAALPAAAISPGEGVQAGVIYSLNPSRTVKCAGWEGKMHHPEGQLDFFVREKELAKAVDRSLGRPMKIHYRLTQHGDCNVWMLTRIESFRGDLPSPTPK